MIRALGIPAALFVLVGFPAIVVNPPKPEAPAAQEAEITIGLEGEPGGADPAYFKVTQPSPPPAEGVSGTLKDAEGEHTATVKVAPESGCEKATTLVADAAETTTWCIALTSVDTGRELSGALVDKTRTLKLKVTRKDAWAGLPVLTLLGGFVVAVLVGLIPTSLRRLVANAVLGRKLRSNRTRTGRERIKGLERLAQDLKGEGKLDEPMIGTLAQVATEGPAKAAEQRTKLRAAVKSSKLPKESPLLTAAIAEGRRTADAVGDFVKPDGTLLEEHPAAAYRGALARLEAYQAELARQDEKIEKRVLKRCREPRTALALARKRLVEIASPGDVARMDPAMEALQTAIETALADPNCVQGAGPAGVRPPEEAKDAEAQRGSIGLTEELEISEGSVGKEVLAWVATIAALLAVVTFAYLTIKQASYDAKPAFGTFDDYFALFSAALGSTAAAGVLALLAYWRPGSDPEAS